MKPSPHFILRAKERANISRDDAIRLYSAIKNMVDAFDKNGDNSNNRIAYLRKAAGKRRVFILNVFGGLRFSAVIVRPNGYPITLLSVQMVGETPNSARDMFKITHANIAQ